MPDPHVEVASHTPRPGRTGVRLYGGPWDGAEVGVRNPMAELIQVNGPRDGNHRVWVSHYYAFTVDRFVFLRTEVTRIE